jgi:hypothetical protein
VHLVDTCWATSGVEAEADFPAMTGAAKFHTSSLLLLEEDVTWPVF